MSSIEKRRNQKQKNRISTCSLRLSASLAGFKKNPTGSVSGLGGSFSETSPGCLSAQSPDGETLGGHSLGRLSGGDGGDLLRGDLHRGRRPSEAEGRASYLCRAICEALFFLGFWLWLSCFGFGFEVSERSGAERASYFFVFLFLFHCSFFSFCLFFHGTHLF